VLFGSTAKKCATDGVSPFCFAKYIITIAKVAMALKLAVHLYRMWRQGRTTVSLKSPGRTPESPYIAVVRSRSPA
jgi:hypothetical protein